ncbi:bacillithiol biosynthesis cysteine-adding enzyme BshC, partial [bacterium]|nr:bacillithiol biosynthesis cysteine-adding enzyme BshC [bacterium]
LLKQSNSVAIVTGQQMGVFGGPLYTVYKALGTVKLCESFQQQFPDYNFVPLFWMELEDHDFEEIRSIQLFNIDNDIKSIVYNGADAGNKSKSPINSIRLNEDIARVMVEIKSTLNPTDFSAELFLKLESAYQNGKSISEAFGLWTCALLGRYGLVLMDPSDAGFKKMAAPVFKKELENAEKIHALLMAQSSALKTSGYSPQVENEPTNLFLRDEGSSKHPLNKNGLNKFKIRSEDAATHRDSLMKLIDTEPDRFIPNVILRPIVQDHLLPTFAYVGGPSEIAYFAQFKTIYEFFEIPEPLIIPRPFITILEKKIKKVTDKYGITVEEIFKKKNRIVDEAATGNSQPSASGQLDTLLLQIHSQFSTVEKNIVSVDPSLKGASETALDKIEKAITILKEKTGDAEKRKNELTHSQLTKAVRHILPQDHFQEREINALYYLNKYGFDFLDTLYEKMAVSDYGHQIVEL